ncbi:MAG: TfoX/Sxy family protein [Ferruginibacter sp.]|nr:TfoX/Sxy family protein [Ferruginibacter sp.]
MAYNEKLADRVRAFFSLSQQDVEEKKMFSGICFMVNDKMCAGVQKDRLMVRLNPDIFEKVLEKKGSVPMDISGKVMKGYVFVEETALATEKKLEYWLKLALDYNPIAKASKKKNK